MLTNRIEDIILLNLINNKEYTKRVIAFLKDEYFFESYERIIFNKINNHILKYNECPTLDAVLIACEKDTDINEKDYNNIVESVGKIASIQNSDQHNQDWLVEETEKFCKEKALFKAIISVNNIIQDKKSKIDVGAIPEILKQALSVSFDSHIGHSYFDDAEIAHDEYHKQERHIPCDLDYINKITKGGVSPKTLSILMAGTNVGKTFFLCHMASSYISQGYNVLYITLEMGAISGIRERIDANLMNATIDDVLKMSKGQFLDRVQKLRSKHSGELIIKEYPTTGANINHFRTLLQELNLKKNFVPDIILVDYLNIVSSCRFKPSSRGDMYVYVKSVVEELRGVAQEFDVPIWTATQTNRDGFKTDDPGLENSSESFGTAMTADLIISMTRTEELDKMGKIKVKVLKNRFNNTALYRRFTLGVDFDRMKIFDDVSMQVTETDPNIHSNIENLKKDDYSSKFRNAFVYDQLLDDDMF